MDAPYEMAPYVDCRNIPDTAGIIRKKPDKTREISEKSASQEMEYYGG